ncbi:MAG: 2-isopropylmalate synthase [Dehalococcoidia bacterium]|nr:2-isopropylmalate synthase [Dehalococcoidia bacterium]
MDKVVIFDTTLRDGEQAAGSSLNVNEKLEIARQLEYMGVDVIEAGFPASSVGDYEAVRTLARQIRNTSICALARAVPADIDSAWEAIKEAETPRLHVFLSTSDIHMRYQLKKTRQQVLETAVAAIKQACRYTSNVEFSPMDATRTAPQFLYQIIEAVLDAGASVINIPDTVGYTIPSEFACFIDSIFANVPQVQQAMLSVHCHDDLGLATANSITALLHGARQVECTVNGIGERAGNTALEEVVMAIATRSEQFNLKTDIRTEQIYRASRLVSDLTGFAVQPNKAVVGANAFRHQSGIHQDGVIKERHTYEVINPQSVGIPSSSLVLGKLSGRHALRQRLEELGYGNLTDEEFKRAFSAFKELADKKKEVTTRDIESLMAEDKRTVTEYYHLERIQVTCGDRGIPTAAVKLIGPQGEELADASLGTGPVDAAYKAINRIVKVSNKLTEFTVNSITGGIDAIGEVLIRIEADGVSYIGRGADPDIVVASAKAYMNALNRLLSFGQQPKTKQMAFHQNQTAQEREGDAKEN